MQKAVDPLERTLKLFAVILGMVSEDETQDPGSSGDCAAGTSADELVLSVFLQ